MSASPDPDQVASRAALVLLTGPSHSGKTSIARSVVRELGVPTGYVAIDQIIDNLTLGDVDLWEHGLPVAYDVAAASAEALLARNFVVILESTFTYVPAPGREPQFHQAEIDRLTGLAARTQVPFVVVRLAADLPELERRRSTTARWPAHVVEGTWHLHTTHWHDPEVELIHVDTGAHAIDEAARTVTAALSERLEHAVNRR